MNSQLKELAVQAKLPVYLLEYGTELCVAPHLEKFAELIVREVLSQVDEFQRLDSAYKNKIGIDPEINVTKEVLKNFGVEE